MPMIIEYIDAIARKKQRDVLHIEFHPLNDSWIDYDYTQDARRIEVIAWLDAHDISWQMCGPLASETCFRSYLGEVYVDIPFDINDPQYQLVCNYLENPDGSMRDENVRWYYLPLELAMKNAHHDEPGFWDNFFENF